MSISSNAVPSPPPRAPSQAAWDAMTPEQRRAVVDALPGHDTSTSRAELLRPVERANAERDAAVARAEEQARVNQEQARASEEQARRIAELEAELARVKRER